MLNYNHFALQILNQNIMSIVSENLSKILYYQLQEKKIKKAEMIKF